MKCRKVIYNKDHYDVVHFGSYGLENPYAIIFNIENDIVLPDKETLQLVDDIYVSPNGTILNHIYSYDESNYTEVEITLNNIILQNEKLLINYTITKTKTGASAPDVDVVNLFARYYTEEMFNAEYSSIVVDQGLSELTGSIEFPILKMSKKWNDGTTSYATKQEGVASSLIQRLSLIQGELWYNEDIGLPLFSKVKDKFIYDSIIINTILKHSDVRGIISYESKVNVKSTNHGTYYFKAEIESVYNEILTINSSMAI